MLQLLISLLKLFSNVLSIFFKTILESLLRNECIQPIGIAIFAVFVGVLLESGMPKC